MISRREFLRRSSEAGVAITAASAGLGLIFAEAVNASLAEEVGRSVAERRSQRSFEIRCDAARAATRLPPPAAFASGTMAVEMAELYWQALTVDVPFQSHNQKFLTEFVEWLACQRGAEPAMKLKFDSEPRYICSNRELAEYVHQDFSFQTYQNAALVMLRLGREALNPTNPYLGSTTQFGDITFGNKNILSLIAQAALLGQKGAYYHKWLVHRRLRPECFAGRIEVHVSGRKPYDMHPEILNCDAIARTKAAHGSCLLPLAFPEGSPTHPSYPAAHSTNAGACATILKALFNEDYPIRHPVEAISDGSALIPWKGEPLTLGNEINKLANNIALGRDAAGVHYRSDSVNGLFVGEEQALGLLCDYSRTYNERFDGFVLSTFRGKRVRIVNSELKSV